jgi:hypothetical protein
MYPGAQANFSDIQSLSPLQFVLGLAFNGQNSEGKKIFYLHADT